MIAHRKGKHNDITQEEKNATWDTCIAEKNVITDLSHRTSKY